MASNLKEFKIEVSPVMGCCCGPGSGRDFRIVGPNNAHKEIGLLKVIGTVFHVCFGHGICLFPGFCK